MTWPFLIAKVGVTFSRSYEHPKWEQNSLLLFRDPPLSGGRGAWQAIKASMLLKASDVQRLLIHWTLIKYILSAYHYIKSWGYKERGILFAFQLLTAQRERNHINHVRRWCDERRNRSGTKPVGTWPRIRTQGHWGGIIIWVMLGILS